MAKQKIQFTFPVESIHRKLTLRANTASDTTRVSTETGKLDIEKPVARYFGAGVRTIKPKGIEPIKTNYVFIRFNKRSTPASSDELIARQRFGFCVTRAQKLRKNLSLIVYITKDYNNGAVVENVSPYGKTFYHYVLGVCFAQFDSGEVDNTSAAGYNQWPGSHA